jgi:hypothetical protein
MRSWILRTALAVTLMCTPLWAQRGGGGFGGGHGGMGGGHGFSGGGHVSAPAGFHSTAGFANHGWNGDGWRGNGWGWRGGRGFQTRLRGWRGYPYWGYGGYWYPWWGGYGWYDTFNDYPSYDQSYGPDGSGYPPPYASAYASLPPSGSSASYASEGEVQRIENEVAQLRAQQASRYAEPSHASTVLVYRDGHKETVENYAVADSTVWIFNQSRARKIPLSELNVPATKQDNEGRGVDFAVPEQP